MTDRQPADAVCRWVDDRRDRWVTEAVVPRLFSATPAAGMAPVLVVELEGPLWGAMIEVYHDGHLAATVLSDGTNWRRRTVTDPAEVGPFLDQWWRDERPVHDLVGVWERNWRRCQPIAHDLKGAYPERWVRFHSLPESKRYPDGEDEYAIVLHRYNAVLDELFAGQDVYVITADWSNDPAPADYWTTVCVNPDPDDPAYWHLHVNRIAWKSGAIDSLLRKAADDDAVGVMITDLEMRRVHHPYDGGADVLLPTTGERDALKARHTDWLSTHRSGY